jgi:hypothetical protein
MFLASMGVDLWRIQLLGRWGSDAFLLYVKDAPLLKLRTVALEAFTKRDMAAVISELQHLKSSLTGRPGEEVVDVEHLQLQATPLLAPLTVADLVESRIPVNHPRPPVRGDNLVINLRSKPQPRLHAVRADGSRAVCGWRFLLAPPVAVQRSCEIDFGALCCDCFGLRKSAPLAVQSSVLGSDSSGSSSSS